MGFGFVFFKKIDKHTLKNSKTNKNTPQNQPKKKKSTTFSDHCYRTHAGKGDGADSVVAGKTKCAATLNLHFLHITIIFVCPEISTVSWTIWLGRLSILKTKICCFLSSRLPSSCSYNWKVAAGSGNDTTTSKSSIIFQREVWFNCPGVHWPRRRVTQTSN